MSTYQKLRTPRSSRRGLFGWDLDNEPEHEKGSGHSESKQAGSDPANSSRNAGFGHNESLSGLDADCLEWKDCFTDSGAASGGEGGGSGVNGELNDGAVANGAELKGRVDDGERVSADKISESRRQVRCA